MIIQHRRRPTGFTLIEILVVVTIIIVLAALIFLGANRAREAAQASVCMNNIREICNDHLALCDENHGVIVHPYRTRVNDGWARNWMLHHTILRNEDLSWREPLAKVQERVMTMNHLQCPTAYRLNHQGMAKQQGFKGKGTYMMNGLIGDDWEPSADRSWIIGARTLSQITDPSRLVMVAEKEWDGTVYGSAGGPIAAVHVYAKFHGGGFHAGFYDGHVEKAKHGEFPIRGKEGFEWGNDEFAISWWGTKSRREAPE